MTCCGIIRGCGRPKLGRVINFIFYCCVALPMAWGLAFYVFSVGVEGKIFYKLAQNTRHSRDSVLLLIRMFDLWADSCLFNL